MAKTLLKYMAALCTAAALLSGCQTSDIVPATPTQPPLSPGWQEIEGETCYVLEDGTLACGWLELESGTYYLRSDGSLVTGWLSLEGEKHYLDSTGAAVSGMLEVDGQCYLFGPRGVMTTGWAELDGKRYYCDSNGHPQTGWVDTEEGRYYLDEDCTMVTGWLEQDGHTYYLTEDGSAATGRVVIEDAEHHFAFNGEKLLLVNPWCFMPEDYTVELTQIGGGHRVADYAYADYLELMAACKEAGHSPVVRSSFRTMTDQKILYANRIQRFKDEGYSTEEATEKAGTIVAVPGTSEHQLGLALDIVDSKNRNLDESQAETATQQWLMENSWRYGWILRYPNEKSDITGIIYEPWHYRYVGREVAAEIHELGLCLEEYLQMLTAGVG